MIDELIKKLKGIIPSETWDFIFKQFPKREMRFTNPPYDAVRVSKDYILVKVPKQSKIK